MHRIPDPSRRSRPFAVGITSILGLALVAAGAVFAAAFALLVLGLFAVILMGSLVLSHARRILDRPPPTASPSLRRHTTSRIPGSSPESGEDAEWIEVEVLESDEPRRS